MCWSQVHVDKCFCFVKNPSIHAFCCLIDPLTLFALFIYWGNVMQFTLVFALSVHLGRQSSTCSSQSSVLLFYWASNTSSFFFTPGVLQWPKTVAGLNPGIPCPQGAATNFKPEPPHTVAKAFHMCTLLGEWATLNTDQCQYKSQVTRILQQYAQVLVQVWALHAVPQKSMQKRCE